MASNQDVLTRRRFLQLAAAFSATLAAPLPALSAPSSNKKLGVALLGLGGYSSQLLAPALQSTTHCELRGIITGSPHKIPRWQQKYGIKDRHIYSYDNMGDIANDDAIDIIYVVTPTGTHKQFSVAAANTGKHVWCEKPMAMNEGECQAIISACQKNNVFLSIGYRMQHEPNTRRFGQFRNTMPYGAFRKLESYAGYAGSGLPADNWRMQKEMGGGALYDMGVYAINEVRFMTGMEPVAVSAKHEKTHPDKFTEVDETTLFDFTFDDGIIARCGTSVVKGFNYFKAHCERGWYELKPMQRYNGVTGRTSDNHDFSPISGMQQSIQMDNDARAIMGIGPQLVSAEEGLKDIRLVNEIFRAAATQQTITLT